MFDSHCHLDACEFDPDRDEVLKRALAEGLSGMLIPAVVASGWVALAKLSAEHPSLHPAYGLHPMYLSAHRPGHIDQLEEFLDQHPAAAIGESGLDFFVDDLDPELQRHYFHAQLRIARERELPVVLHARRAHEEVLHTVRHFAPLRGVIHSFAGSLEQARQFIECGFLLGFGGPITYPRANRLRRLVRELPAESLLVETDAPDQPLFGHQGQRNEPARLRQVIETMAELRGCSAEQIARLTEDNARRLFGLPVR